MSAAEIQRPHAAEFHGGAGLPPATALAASNVRCWLA
jgi:hypothetical protein